ncbi:hypothetical protein BTA51_21975 [Hahella sp. CCB-MM4]|uniref:phospholipase D-like domain-containing protein n=1 Tax=Hahella sp. (strain CCB-MM4) TaxID=1926491 RepID=UPI000B9C67DB|nr:phosphatidylserine/phosphatidylglycerophosphate/cardiolipin synthase family protein [Hahella sp. CCB-MM4]OZG71309.1 hypothetical protein BTA51_21975 [Hahella sp. CCB-MM4]
MFRYPLRQANSFELIVGGDAYLARLLELVNSATREILIEMYLVEQGRAFDLLWVALDEALERGVSVYLLLDGFGSRQVLPFLQEQKRYRINLHFVAYNPISLKRIKSNFHRDHRKLIIVDQMVSVVSGFGINDDFYGEIIGRPVSAEPPWLDTAIVAEGEVVRDWRQLFCQVWKVGEVSIDGSMLSDGSNALSDGNTPGRVAYGAGLARQDIVREFGARVRKATSRVWIISPYFLTSWRIRRLLRRVSRQGVDVRILVPGAFTDHPPVTYASRRYYLRLLRAGVRLYEYQKSFIHSKVYVCDDWVSIGSYNLDHWAYRFNLEANQEVVSKEFSDQVGSFYQNCIDHSTEITADYLQKQKLLDRILTYLLGKLEQLIIRIIR